MSYQQLHHCSRCHRTFGRRLKQRVCCYCRNGYVPTSSTRPALSQDYIEQHQRRMAAESARVEREQAALVAAGFSPHADAMIYCEGVLS